MTVLAPRGTKIPCSKTETFSTYADNQPAVTLRVFQGERKLTRDNNLLGQFNLEGIAPAPRGVPKIKVQFDVDADSILRVSATDEASGKMEHIEVRNQGRFTDAEIKEMLRTAETMQEEDKREGDRIEAKLAVENSVYSMRNHLNEQSQLGETERARVDALAKEFIEWLDRNTTATTEEYEAKRKEVEEQFRPFLEKAAQAGGGQPSPMPQQQPHGSGPTVEEVD